MAGDDLTREQAAEILRETVPGAEVVGVARMNGGEVSGAYEVLCADPAQNAVVKVYAVDKGWTLKKEISVYRLLRENGLTKMPRLLGGAGKDGFLGRPYLVMSKLPGVTVETLSPELSDAHLRSVYRQMGEQLAQFHAIDQDAYGFRGIEIIDPQPTNEAYMKATFARVSKTYLDATGDRDLYEAAHRYVAVRTELFALCLKPVFLHNDFHEGNVLMELTPNGPMVSGFIDVENAMAGDPMVDLSKTHCYSIHDNRIKLDGLFEGYGEVPVEWERRSLLFRVVHLFELWDFYHHYAFEVDTAEKVAADLRALIAAG